MYKSTFEALRWVSVSLLLMWMAATCFLRFWSAKSVTTILRAASTLPRLSLLRAIELVYQKCPLVEKNQWGHSYPINGDISLSIKGNPDPRRLSNPFIHQGHRLIHRFQWHAESIKE
ncbi:hypothetical protein BN873_470031 [Candidatus Competibacter denitrificans Run_A_D11]|uniref:Uncharacterized protein n=1 Tax=Candidatus Competibacter denitrificans Run_A_D11 TaxID=1400863 RepID=W6M9J9_9GAMM|nr:hypothetical protein BN873_470031 [Candidatus Competibacter denitrificans Run_A_D11]